MGKRFGASAAVLSLLVVALAPSANAESGFNQVWNATLGDESSRWTDNNFDNVNGYGQFYNCSPSGSYRLQVYRDVTGFDPKLADGATCSAKVYHGDPSAGRFYVRWSQGPAFNMTGRLAVAY